MIDATVEVVTVAADAWKHPVSIVASDRTKCDFSYLVARRRRRARCRRAGRRRPPPSRRARTRRRKRSRVRPNPRNRVNLALEPRVASIDPVVGSAPARSDRALSFVRASIFSSHASAPRRRHDSRGEQGEDVRAALHGVSRVQESGAEGDRSEAHREPQVHVLLGLGAILTTYRDRALFWTEFARFLKRANVLPP